jgi:tRNA nucleotidyltransferase (CCA-adding enzyme)
MQVYLVGGAVRDELLNRSVVDRDWVVTGATPEELLAKSFIQVGKEFPCFLHPQTKEEYALARTERKAGKGHRGFICDFNPGITLEQDLARRDLTINAIAKDSTGHYLDPYGGIKDLKAKILRHVSPAFAEDPLRVLRVARFAARYTNLGFYVHPDTLALMAGLVKQGELKALTPERVWKETERALSEPKPSEFFLVLHQCDALQVVLPELALLLDNAAPDGKQAMRLIDYARRYYNQPIITWALLLQALTKESAKQHSQEKVGHLVEIICRRFKVPKSYKELARLVSLYCSRFTQLANGSAADILQLIELVDGLRRPKRFDQFVQACEAEARLCLKLADDQIYRPSQLLSASLAASKQLDTQALLAKGYTGKELAKQIRYERISRIDQCLAQL